MNINKIAMKLTINRFKDNLDKLNNILLSGDRYIFSEYIPDIVFKDNSIEILNEEGNPDMDFILKVNSEKHGAENWNEFCYKLLNDLSDNIEIFFKEYQEDLEAEGINLNII